MINIQKIDALLAPGNFAPRWGFHDDHRHADGTPAYLPALQQVRAEFEALADVLDRHQMPSGVGALYGRCLQLGIGECNASHEVWRNMFSGGAVTADWSGLYIDGRPARGGADTHAPIMQERVAEHDPYEFLFIDAGHSFDDVRKDHLAYGPMVRQGGIITFHDSLPRKGYEEVEVWRYLAEIEAAGTEVHRIGTEVGVAWIVKE